ncbi:MAG: DUF4169 family protein [Cypionkella sp.]
MAEIVNLRAVRKAKERAAARAQADANTVKFGRRKGDKAREEARKAKETREFDGHARE